jgi:Predicted phosphohydrolases
MSVSNKIQTISFPADCRILVISDIHANNSRFEHLLAQMQYNHGTDYLIINGDLIEKGQENMQIVATIMQLVKSSNRVYVLEGNCDDLITCVLNEVDLWKYLNYQPLSLINEWLQVIGIDKNRIYLSPSELKKLLQKHFQEELHWFTNLPTVLESEEFIFVHAGITSNTIDIRNRMEMLSIQWFLNKGHNFAKTVIVGHFPTRNYCTNTFFDSSIIIDERKKIISLDGGNQLDADGQLNGLLITKANGKISYQQYSEDEFATTRIKTDYTPDLKNITNVVWPYSNLTILEKNQNFSLCIVEKYAGTPQWFKNEYIETIQNKSQLKKYHATYQLPVQRGDEVKIIDDSCTGYTYIKKNGIVGWVPKDLL